MGRVMSAAPSSSPMVSVCDGRDCIGWVFNRSSAGFEAFDRDQKSLGIFRTQREAATAIMREAAAAIPAIVEGKR